MKTIFEGEINGVKYTDENSFMAALASAKSSGTIRSMSYKTQEVSDENQLDLFDNKSTKIDNLFPCIDQAIDAMEKCNELSDYLDTMDEIENDLDERFKWLNREMNNIDFRGVFDKINESKKRIDVVMNHYDNEHRLLNKEREELDRAYEELEDKDARNNFMTDLMSTFKAYYDGISNNINIHLKTDKEVRDRKCNTERKNEPALKVNEKPYNIDTDTFEKLSKAFEMLEQLWK